MKYRLKNITSFIIINLITVLSIVLIILYIKNIVYIIALLLISILVNIINFYRIYIYKKENNINIKIDEFFKDIYLNINIDEEYLLNIDSNNKESFIKDFITNIKLDNTYTPYLNVIMKINNNIHKELLLYLYLYSKNKDRKYLESFNDLYLINIEKENIINKNKDKVKESLIMSLPLIANIVSIISLLSISIINIFQ